MTQENVLRWVALVRRSAWWLIIPAILGVAVGAYQATRSDTVVYSSKMVLFFQAQLPRVH